MSASAAPLGWGLFRRAGAPTVIIVILYTQFGYPAARVKDTRKMFPAETPETEDGELNFKSNAHLCTQTIASDSYGRLTFGRNYNLE